MDWNDVVSFIQEQGFRLLQGILVLIIGFFLARMLIKLAEKKIKLKRMDPTLHGFLHNLVRILLYTLVLLTAVNIMGIPLTSIITLAASAGVAVSLAMQGALSNLVGGITLLILKPVKSGDFVKIGDLEGTVQSIGAFYTELTTPDNRHISMPNSSLTNTAIVNYTREGTRRLDVNFSVSYQSDMNQVFSVLEQLIRENSAILPDPAPVVHLSQMGDNGLTYFIRVWCKNEDYWPIHFFLMEEGKKALDRAGIEIPFPQVDVHMK